VTGSGSPETLPHLLSDMAQAPYTAIVHERKVHVIADVEDRASDSIMLYWDVFSCMSKDAGQVLKM